MQRSRDLMATKSNDDGVNQERALSSQKQRIIPQTAKTTETAQNDDDLGRRNNNS